MARFKRDRGSKRLRRRFRKSRPRSNSFRVRRYKGHNSLYKDVSYLKMRARREAPEWKQWNNTWSDDFASTTGYFPAGQQVIFVGAAGGLHGGPFSVSFPADQGSLTIAGGAPSPIQFANLMVGNTINMRKLTYFFSFKLIPAEFNGVVPPYTATNNPRNMELGQQIGVRLVFCRFKNMNQAAVNAYDPVNQLFDSYSTVVPNPGIFDQGTAMIGSFIEGIRNVCSVWREKRFYLSLDNPYKEFKVSFKFPRGLPMTKKFDTTLGVYFNDAPISYFAIITTGMNVPFDIGLENLMDPTLAPNVPMLRNPYGLQLYQLYKYWYTDS